MEVSKLLLRYQEGQRDFRQVSLRAANLARAQLAFVNFDQGDLREANLKAAQLAGANLEGAELTNANLAGANLLGATLLSARLIRTNLEGALLSGADLRGAILKQANLRNASCVGIDLSGADLQGANLKDINLKDANLRGANLMGAQWDRADVEGAHFDGAIMPNGEYVVPEEMSNASPGGIDEFNFPTIEERIDDLNSPTLERSFPDEDSQPDSAPLPQNPGSEVGTLLFGDVSLDTAGNVNAPGSSSPSGIQGQFMPTGMAGASDRGTPLGAGTGGDLQVWIRSKLQKQNQYQFRRLVAQAYGNQCAVTGSRIQPVLKVVSIAEGTKTGQDHPSNGILLRSDFAILFREHLVAIEPTTGTLLLAPSLRESDYQVWENKPLDLPAKESEKPDVVLLQQHISACRWYQAEQSVQQRQRATKVAGATQARHLWRSALQNLLGTKKPEPDPPLESSANPGAGVAATPAAPLSPTVLREPETAKAGVDAVHRDDVPTSWNPTSSSSIPKATSPAVPAPIAIPETPPDPVPEEQTEGVTGIIGSSAVPDPDS
ncbi:pentapeptide repeat-containing protein, partial [Prochlorothrix hollandica]|uniref:pentapeptide repeat-containing protein n=1 Tax=Prochlorothrix hollandica TaxID=1223 RepID=UPI0033419474